MKTYQLALLEFFFQGEKTLGGEYVDWEGYDFKTMQELDRLRREVGSPCRVIRGGDAHGESKETAVDAAFPQAPFAHVVMALFRSGFSKGLYEGGSIHLDHRMGPSGLARCWMAFKPESQYVLAGYGFLNLKTYSKDGWDYYDWGHPWSWDLLKALVKLNAKETEV